MKLGVLYSGGKDSTYAMMIAKKYHDVACLISIISKNKDSFMFQTANIQITELQAKALNLPIVQVKTKGTKEDELIDLKTAIKKARDLYKIGGIVTGAIRSTYQSSRIQKICHELNLWCFNPLWLKDQTELLNEIVKNKIEAVISSVSAEGLNESFLGKKINSSIVKKLKSVAEKHKINAAGEGGEFESTVLNCPMFKNKITITKSKKQFIGGSGTFEILDAKLT